jgi:hypothetical protein
MAGDEVNRIFDARLYGILTRSLPTRSLNSPCPYRAWIIANRSVSGIKGASTTACSLEVWLIRRQHDAALFHVGEIAVGLAPPLACVARPGSFCNFGHSPAAYAYIPLPARVGRIGLGQTLQNLQALAIGVQGPGQIALSTQHVAYPLVAHRQIPIFTYNNG